MADVKWSSFALDEPPLITDMIVGLRAGANVNFSSGYFPFRTLYAGVPIGNVAGQLGDFVIDTAHGNALYMCNLSGNAASAGWELIDAAGGSPIITGAGTGSAIGGDLATSVASANYAFAFGEGNTTASGLHSFAFGAGQTASASYSFCFGGTNANPSVVSGIYSASFGSTQTNAANFSLTFGNLCTTTSGKTSAFAFGLACTVGGSYSFAIGNNAIVNNDGSVVWGDHNINPFQDTAADQFCLTFAGGYRFSLGSLKVLTVGKGLAVAEGSNAKQGTITLTAGVGVVSNTSVTASSKIFYNGQDTNVTGFLRLSARTNGSGFTITSSVLSDTGVVAYEIFEPAT